MTDQTIKADTGPDRDLSQRPLTPAASRALAEAKARREEYREKEAALQKSAAAAARSPAAMATGK